MIENMGNEQRPSTETAGQRRKKHPAIDNEAVLIRVVPSTFEQLAAYSGPPGTVTTVSWGEPDSLGVYKPVLKRMKVGRCESDG